MHGTVAIGLLALFASLGCGCEAGRSGRDPLARDMTPVIEDRHALSDHSCRSDAERAFLTVLNEIRANLQAPPVLCLEELQHFMLELGSLRDSHPEYRLAVFRAARLADLAYDRFWLADVQSHLEEDAPLTQLLRNPGHRSALLSPQLRYLTLSGTESGEVRMAAMLWRSDSDGLAPVVFPTEDLPARIPSKVSAAEAGLPVGDKSIGFPISVHFPRFIDPWRGGEPELSVRRFKLYEKSELSGFVEVAATIRTRRSRADLGGGDLMLLPKAPMQPAHRYFVEFEGRYGDIHLEQNWFFQTRDVTAPTPLLEDEGTKPLMMF